MGVAIQTGDNTVLWVLEFLSWVDRTKTYQYSGRIAKLSSMEATRMTTLQREILYFVFIIASLATTVAILIVVLWATWYVYFR